jgi:hypothetical protein
MAEPTLSDYTAASGAARSYADEGASKGAAYMNELRREELDTAFLVF